MFSSSRFSTMYKKGIKWLYAYLEKIFDIRENWASVNSIGFLSILQASIWKEIWGYVVEAFLRLSQ